MGARKKKELPVDIYLRFVETLFRDGNTLALGVGSQVLLAVLVYWRTDAIIYLLIAVALLVGGIVRLVGIRKYRNTGPPASYEEGKQRERYYILLGTIHASSLGFFCFTGIYLEYDPYAEIASVAVTLASVTSIVGRNYGSPSMVMIMIVTVTWPISLGFILRGDVYHVVLGLMSAPFFFAIRKYADNVREVLFAALSEQKKASSIAQRFNRALNTMSHGLIMLGPDGRVAVANAEAAAALGVRSPNQLMGRTLEALLMRGVAAGMLSMNDCRYAEAQLTRALRDGGDRKILLSLSNGRHLEFSARASQGELGVITFEDVTQRIEAEEKVRSMARYDNLTGLPNRAYFHELVAELLAAGDRDRLCGLAVFDLDDFKSVNDTLGHPVGDGLIYAVAERLAGFAEDGVKVSRFGGDEFMVYFDEVEDYEALDRMLDHMFANVQGDVDVAGHALRVQVSAGAVLSRVMESDVDAMIVKADLALYKAKELGKNGWRLFEASMDAAFRNRQLMKAELRSAVEMKNLRVVYQPIVRMDTMRIAACEALCRWDHPDLGSISPAIFIPLAEEMGIISDISAFMLEAACRECVKWPEHISVSINLSAKDFRNQEIIERVREALASSGLAAHRLEIEVTETALLDDKSQTSRYIRELKLLGVRIALDDFGTGYSSLSYLHKLPLDKIKIDRSFLIDVTLNERSLELITGVVSLSRSLGLVVTIEGVETFDQLKILATHVHPDLVQGFLFGSALSANGIETMSSTVWPFVPDGTVARRIGA